MRLEGAPSESGRTHSDRQSLHATRRWPPVLTSTASAVGMAWQRNCGVARARGSLRGRWLTGLHLADTLRSDTQGAKSHLAHRLIAGMDCGLKKGSICNRDSNRFAAAWLFGIPPYPRNPSSDATGKLALPRSGDKLSPPDADRDLGASRVRAGGCRAEIKHLRKVIDPFACRQTNSESVCGGREGQ